MQKSIGEQIQISHTGNKKIMVSSKRFEEKRMKEIEIIKQLWMKRSSWNGEISIEENWEIG